MKITLIWPNIGRTIRGLKQNEDEPFKDKACMEPHPLAVLAALCPPEVEIEMFDDRIEAINYDTKTDLVAISVEIFTAMRAYEISNEFRKRGTKTILGGIHVSLQPDEALQFSDSVCIGDAENIWLEILNDLSNKHLKKIYKSSIGVAHTGKIPNRSIYNGKKYLPLTLTQFSRGCSHNCNFCAINIYSSKKCYYRKIDETIKEIAETKNKLFFFTDDNIISNKYLAKELFNELKFLKINWVGQASIDMTTDHELMKAMQRSGCIGHVIGFETINNEGLSIISKKQNQLNSYDMAIKILKDHNIFIWAAFLMGHDAETKESIYNTLDFCLKHQFMFSAYNILMPYPQTPMYEYLKQQNRLLYNEKWWLHPEYRFNYAAFKPKNLTSEELTNFCFDIRKKWNSYSSIFKRICGIIPQISAKQILFFTRFLLLYRKESFKKQGMKLGYNKYN